MSTPELLSLEEFFGPPVRSGAAISPDGEKIAFLAPWENRLNVWVQDLAADASTETEARCLTADDARSVLNFRWTDDRGGCCTCRTSAATRTTTCTASTSPTPTHQQWT